MRHEEIIKRPDGSKVRIDVYFWLNHDKPRYDVNVYRCDKGKRTWRGCYDEQSYEYRRLSIEDRQGFKFQKQKEFVSDEEIIQAQMVIWNKLKPGQ